MRKVFKYLFPSIIISLIISCENRTLNSKIISPPAFTYRNGVKPDSSDLYSILIFKPEEMNFFSSEYRPTSLTNADLKSIDSLLNIAVKTYNSKRKNLSLSLYQLKEYRKQFVAIVSPDGSKEVYVNCFKNWAYEEKTWKKQLVIVEDGGRNYFHIKINLSKKRYYEMLVNGLG